MVFHLLQRWGNLGVLTAAVRALLWIVCGLATVDCAATGPMAVDCPRNTCPAPASSFRYKLGGGPVTGESQCYPAGTALSVTCEIGFQRVTDEGEHFVSCLLDGTWKWSDLCKTDTFSVIIACIVILVIMCLFFMILYCVCKCCKCGKKSKNKTSG